MLISININNPSLLKAAGFDCVDFFIGPKDRDAFVAGQEDGDFIGSFEAIKKEGLFVGQVHMPFLPNGSEHYEWNNYKSFEDFILEPLKKCVEICSKIECRTAVLHLYYGDDPEDTWNGNIKLIGELLPVLEKYDVRLALENVYAHDGKNYIDSYVAYPEQLMKYVEYFDSEYVGICLDTGHANIFGIDVIAAVELFGKKLFALHTNANAGEDQHAIPMTVPAWLDKTDYEKFARTLAEIGYEGTMNFEISTGTTPACAEGEFIQYAAAVARHLADVFEKSFQ